MLVAAPVPEVRTFTLWWISCCRRHLGGRYCWMVAGYVGFMQQLIRSRRSLYFRAKWFHHYQCAAGIVFHLNSEALVHSQVSEAKIALLVFLLIYPCQHPMGRLLPQIDKSKAIFLPAIQNQHHFPWDSLGKFVCAPPETMLNLKKFSFFYFISNPSFFSTRFCIMFSMDDDIGLVLWRFHSPGPIEATSHVCCGRRALCEGSCGGSTITWEPNKGCQPWELENLQISSLFSCINKCANFMKVPLWEVDLRDLAGKNAR